MNAAMVEIGAAQAFRRYAADYVTLEERAAEARRGIWQGEHSSPSDYRRRTTHRPIQTAATGCQIKGNISNSGKIYHMPGQRDYAGTHISAAKGERWFCSEEEAVASGWRRARR